MRKAKAPKWLFTWDDKRIGHYYDPELGRVVQGDIEVHMRKRQQRHTAAYYFIGPNKRIGPGRFMLMGNQVTYALLRAGFETVDDLARTPDEDILKCVFVGKKTLEHTRRFIPFVGEPE